MKSNPILGVFRVEFFRVEFLDWKRIEFLNIPLGKNIVSLVPWDKAKFLKKENVNSFTIAFHIKIL